MGYVTTEDNVQIFYTDWGPRDAQPIVFHHGWPLSSDDWDAQMRFFLEKGYRVVAHDRRGHGRSSQVAEGHDIDGVPEIQRLCDGESVGGVMVYPCLSHGMLTVNAAMMNRDILAFVTG